MLDSTHIHAYILSDIVTCFHGRNPYPTKNVLVAVDFKLKFTYVLVNWKGLAYDALILWNTLEREDGVAVPKVMISLY